MARPGVTLPSQEYQLLSTSGVDADGNLFSISYIKTAGLQ